MDAQLILTVAAIIGAILGFGGGMEGGFGCAVFSAFFTALIFKGIAFAFVWLIF